MIEDIVTNDNFFVCGDAKISFRYDSAYDGCCIGESEGSAQKLMIPDKINGKAVKDLRADFFSVNGYDEVVINRGNEYFAVRDGVLFSTYLRDNGAALKLYPPEKKDEAYAVPPGAGSVSGCAFRNRYLKKLYLPEGLQQLGDYAVDDCGALEEIYIPASFKVFWFRALNSKGIKKIFYQGTKEQWDKIEDDAHSCRGVFEKAEILFEADISFKG